jgi:hypothetical protein
MGWPHEPVIYEVNTAIWLQELSSAAGRPRTLADVAPAEWDAVTPDGVDAIWLMGVWERSPAGLAIAKSNPSLMASFREALPDLKDEDIVGSPYCVRRYVADAAFGGESGLAAARRALAARGKRLILDYVPNHVAPDHPWVTERPDLFIRGSATNLAQDPDNWLDTGNAVLAHGRDPYFPSWPDVVQLNAFSPEMRSVTVETLSTIAAQCDGIRCDMAMLLINRIFAKTWGEYAGTEPSEEFWPQIIAALRSLHPDTVLFAEAYWDLEWELQQQGLDCCYDKRLYDRIVGRDVAGIHDHLTAGVDYQSRLVRFLENHDEPRIAGTLPPETQRAAAVTIATLPGATLWHEGQFEGRRVRPPVFLRRRPDEPADNDLAQWYARLLAIPDIRSGVWQLLGANGWPDNQSCRNLLAWQWTDEIRGIRRLVVVNLSSTAAQGRIPLPWATGVDAGACRLRDLLGDEEFVRDGAELRDPGLFVDLPAWQFYVFDITSDASDVR